MKLLSLLSIGLIAISGVLARDLQQTISVGGLGLSLGDDDDHHKKDDDDDDHVKKVHPQPVKKHHPQVVKVHPQPVKKHHDTCSCSQSVVLSVPVKSYGVGATVFIVDDDDCDYAERVYLPSYGWCYIVEEDYCS